MNSEARFDRRLQQPHSHTRSSEDLELPVSLRTEVPEFAGQAAGCKDVHRRGTDGCLGVLLIGGDFQSLSIMRSLNRAQIPFYLLASERGIACCSRYAKRSCRRDDLFSMEDGAGFLRELAEQENLDGWVIFCVNDDAVEFLAKNHARLSTRFVLPVPPWEITQKFYEKDRAVELATGQHIPVPRTYRASGLDDLLAQDIDYPIVLKPTFKKNYYEVTNDKAIKVQNERELVVQYAQMLELIPPSQIVVQEFLPGGTRNLFSYAAIFDGQNIVSGLSAIRLRQHPMDFGHATTHAESRDVPELKELAERFLRALDYRGIAEIEFMYDERTQEFKFLEMNGRFWGWHSLTEIAGLQFPADLYRMLLGQTVLPKQPQAGVRWTRLITDVPTVARECLLGRMNPLVVLRNFRGRTGFAVLSWRDPLPFLVEVLWSPYLWWKKGF